MILTMGGKPGWFGQKMPLAVAQITGKGKEVAIDHTFLRPLKHKCVVDLTEAAATVVQFLPLVTTPGCL
jgi:hypothetical protein